MRKAQRFIVLSLVAGASLVASSVASAQQVARQITKPQLERMLAVGRSVPGARVNARQLQRTLEGTLANPLAGLIARSEEMRLTDSQADSVAILNHRFALDVDGTWAPIANALAALPTDFDADAAWALVAKGYAETSARLQPLVEAAKVVVPQAR